MKNFIALIGISFVLLNSQTSTATQLYKWVDQNGNISYQDTPPPKGSKVLDAKTVEGSKSNGSQPGKMVSVYTVDECESCTEVITKLQALNINHEVKSLNDRDAQALILEATGSLLAPTLKIGDKVITDISQKNLERELSDAGYVLPEKP